MIATRAPERLCYARLADYARERLGISARQVQDLSHVHRALVGLPLLERALVANELPWSKVRLLARVATAADEGTWIARAHRASTRWLEGEVRRAMPSGAAADGVPEPLQRVVVRCTPATREKWSLVRELAERVAGARLSEDEVLELVAAEVFSTVAIDPARAHPEECPSSFSSGSRAPEEPHEPPSRTTPTRSVRAPARALPDPVAALATGLEGANAFELDRRLRAAVRLEQTLDAAMAPLLRVVRSGEHEWQGDYAPLSSYAPEQLGMSYSKARALLRLERGGDVCPELRDAYRSGRLSWVKAQCLLPLLLLDIPGEWRAIWVAWAARVTVRRLAADVERALLLHAGHEPAWQRCKLRPDTAQDPIPDEERQLCAHEVDVEATEELAWRVPREVAVLFFGVLHALRAKLQRDGDVRFLESHLFDRLLDHAWQAWMQRDPEAPRPDPVIERDGYRCAVPGCTSRRNLHDHHVAFRSAGGSDAPDNRITLCAFHHLRCLHAGRLAIRGRAPDALVFVLGVRSDGPCLARYRSGDVALDDLTVVARVDTRHGAARAPRARGSGRSAAAPPLPG